MYYRWRNYSPSIGRFLWRDPIGYADGVNPYSYVINIPLVGVDPYGLFFSEIGTGVSNTFEGAAIVLGLTSLDDDAVAAARSTFKRELKRNSICVTKCMAKMWLEALIPTTYGATFAVVNDIAFNFVPKRGLDRYAVERITGVISTNKQFEQRSSVMRLKQQLFRNSKYRTLEYGRLQNGWKSIVDGHWKKIKFWKSTPGKLLAGRWGKLAGKGGAVGLTISSLFISYECGKQCHNQENCSE